MLETVTPEAAQRGKRVWTRKTEDDQEMKLEDVVLSTSSSGKDRESRTGVSGARWVHPVPSRTGSCNGVAPRVLGG